MPSVFDFLKQVEQRPGMFFTQLDQLESVLFGYQSALRVHSIDERGPYIGHFREWLEYETGWSLSCGWASAIRDHVPAEERTARFFEFIWRFIEDALAAAKGRDSVVIGGLVVSILEATQPPLRIGRKHTKDAESLSMTSLVCCSLSTTQPARLRFELKLRLQGAGRGANLSRFGRRILLTLLPATLPS